MRAVVVLCSILSIMRATAVPLLQSPPIAVGTSEKHVKVSVPSFANAQSVPSQAGVSTTPDQLTVMQTIPETPAASEKQPDASTDVLVKSSETKDSEAKDSNSQPIDGPKEIQTASESDMQLPSDPTHASADSSDKGDEPALVSSDGSMPDAENMEALQLLEEGSLFKKVFYINLDKDNDRRDHMEKHLRSHGFNYERVPAITPQMLCDHKYDYLIPSGSVWPIECPSDGSTTRELRSMSCDASHRLVLDKIAMQPDDGLYLLLEDDVAFIDGWQEKFRNAFKHLPKDWSVARMGYWGKEDGGDKVNEFWYRSNRHIDYWDENNAYYYGAHALVFDKKHAQQLLERVKGHQVEYFDKFTADGVVGPSYVMTASVVNPSGFDSSKENGAASASSYKLAELAALLAGPKTGIQLQPLAPQ